MQANGEEGGNYLLAAGEQSKEKILRTPRVKAQGFFLGEAHPNRLTHT